MCVYVSLSHAHTHAHTHMHTYKTHIHIHVGASARTHTHIHTTYSPVRTRIHTHARTYTYERVYIRVFTRTYTYECVHIGVFIYTYTVPGHEACQHLGCLPLCSHRNTLHTRSVSYTRTHNHKDTPYAGAVATQSNLAGDLQESAYFCGALPEKKVKNGKTVMVMSTHQ